MKCKRLLTLTLALLLTGCAAPKMTDVFYVEDAQTLPPALFSIQFGVPMDAVEAVCSDDGLSKLYQAEDGSYQIQTRILPGFDAAQALQELTGSTEETLHPIKTRRLGMTEYRFSWCSQGEDGLLLQTGTVLQGEDACYCLVFTTPEDGSRACRELQRQVLESFSLFGLP